MFSERGVSGALCQRISRREPQSSSISICGNGMAPWGGCTMRSSSHARAGGQGSQPDGRDHQQPKRQGRRKRGAWIDPSGYDAGKKVKGKKRHILVDTLGLPLNVVVHPANIQDRDGGLLILKVVRRLSPFIERIFADGGFQGEATAAAVRALGPWQLEIVKRSDHTVGFEVLPQRWILGSSPRTERTFAWL